MRTHAPIFAALTALLLVPHVAAEAISQHVVAHGDIDQTSRAFNGMSLAGDEAGGITELRIGLQAGHAVAWEQLAAAASTMPICPLVNQTCFSLYQPVPFTDTAERSPTWGEWPGGNVTLLDAVSPHRVNVLPLGGASITAKGASLVMESIQDACLGERGIRPAEPGRACNGYDDGVPFLSAVPMPSPVQVMHADGPATFVLRGDFALEVLNLALAAPDGEELNAVTEETASGNLQEYRFVRLVVRDAVIEITTQAMAQAVWATGAATTRVVGEAHMADLVGSLDMGEVHLLDDRVGLTGSFTLHTEPSSDGVRLTGEQRPQGSAPPMSTSTVPETAMGWSAAIAAALVATGMVAAMAGRRDPRVTMQDVEDALQAGQYTEAAWMSTRILRADPDHESAHLGRGIALTKAGRFQDAVAHLRAYLEGNDPKDGTLHYVLGTALKELGEHGAADEALAEAAQRTPSLAGPASPGSDGAAYT